MTTAQFDTKRLFEVAHAQTEDLAIPVLAVITIGLIVFAPLVFETLGVIEHACLFADRMLFGTQEVSDIPGRTVSYFVWTLYTAILLPLVLALIVIVSLLSIFELALTVSWKVVSARIFPARPSIS